MIARYVTDFLFEASSEELYNKFYKDIKPDIYNKIIKADPTSTDRKNGKYCKWLLDLYKNNKLLIEDLYKATEYLTLFNKYGSKLQKNQIQMYKSLPELFQEIKQFQEKVPREDLMSNKDKYKDIKDNQTEKVYEDSEWLVISPKTKESSMFWGQGTQWCTAAKKDNAFKVYNKYSPLFILISKKLKDNEGRQLKYQFSFYNTFGAQLMNSNDEHIKKGELILNDKIFKVFYNIIKSNSEYYKGAYQWAKCIGNEEQLKDIVIKSDDMYYIYQWAKEIGNRNEIKNILFQNKYSELYAYNWAKEIGDKDEMKQIILKTKNAEHAYYWAKNIGDKEEMKEVILKAKKAEHAYLWAKEIGDREEMKQIILKSNNPQFAYYWAKNIGDKEEMKQVILKAKKAEHAYNWAKEIGDKDEMKQIILKSNNPQYAYYWAKNIGDKEEMKQIVLNTTNSRYAYHWAQIIGDKEEMKQIVLNTTDPWDAYYWAQTIGNKDEMKPIVFNSNKEKIINGWKKYIE